MVTKPMAMAAGVSLYFLNMKCSRGILEGVLYSGRVTAPKSPLTLEQDNVGEVDR